MNIHVCQRAKRHGTKDAPCGDRTEGEATVNVRTEDWPLVLAGPIVRRVEPHLVALWVALKEARSVRLSVFDAPVQAGAETTVFSEPTPLMSNVTRTIRVGDHLHVAVATTASDDPLLPGQTYSYNLSFGDGDVESFAATEDLRSLLLLLDHHVGPDDEDDAAGPPHFALGYEQGRLPTFLMSPDNLTDLRIAHGSCRRPHARTPDVLASLDDEIKTAVLEIEGDRPHQLFLTGDQIYADDVAVVLLRLCTEIGNALLGQVEHLPVSWGPPPVPSDPPLPVKSLGPVPADGLHFPAGLRKAIVQQDAQLTTTDGDSHLLSLGEFCAMHLLSWSNVLWPRDLPTFAQLFWDSPPDSDFLNVLQKRMLPPAIWQLHMGLSQEDGATMESEHGFKSHFNTTKKLDVFNAENVAKVLQAASNAEENKDKVWRAVTRDAREVASFRKELPKVRRALANVSTYMIFDDHEITDDWNLSRLWRQRVLGSPLGTTVLRNGMLAYLVCQGWGNDPAAFEEDVRVDHGALLPGPRKRLLYGVVPRLFPSENPTPPDTAATEEADGLLGLDGADPPVQWHYRIDGPRHRVLVLDSRTRRDFSTQVADNVLTAPPSNLSPTAIDDQLPTIEQDRPPVNMDVLFVVSPAPLLGVPLFDELAGPLAYRASDLSQRDTANAIPGTNPDAIEGWSNAPDALEEVLGRLSAYRRVVVLSGDVHYGHSCELTYWTTDPNNGDGPLARIAQFTSSGLKNVWPENITVMSRSIAFFDDAFRLFEPVHRHGWHSNEPAPLRFVGADERGDVPSSVRMALLKTKVLLPDLTLPSGTVIERSPDWSWQLRIVADTRPRSDLPPKARPAPLGLDDSTADDGLTLDFYRAAAQRHGAQLDKVTHTRRILFASNLGIVTLHAVEGDGPGAPSRLLARHELFAWPGAQGASVFVCHDVELDPVDVIRPPVLIQPPRTDV